MIERDEARRLNRRARAKLAMLGICAVFAAAIASVSALAQGGSSGSGIDSAWLKTLSASRAPSSVQNNLVPGAVARNAKAVSDWRAATARYQNALAHARSARAASRATLSAAAARLAPDPYAKPDYLVVWSSHANASDEATQQGQRDANRLSNDPVTAGANAQDRFVPGLDGFVVLDARKRNIDGSRNRSYGKVVNFVQLPLPWGAETEAHHMQYDWENGEPILAGGLFNDTTFVIGVKSLPKLALLNTVTPQETPNGSVPDAYDASGGGHFIGTYMGGPNYNYAGSPGEVVAFDPSKTKGAVMSTETVAGVPDARDVGNPGGIPEPCSQDEAAPLNTCANPHGVQVRPDLSTMVTSDYGEPKTVVMDPVKPRGGTFFRPTVRTWNTQDPDHPKLVSVAHMDSGWRAPNPNNTMLQNRGIMENAKTWPSTPQFRNVLASKGAFAGAMCGGGVFFTPNVKALRGDATRQWHEVWDDGIALLAARGGDVTEWMKNEGSCEGGAWMQVTRNNRWLFRTVGGTAPNQDNLSGASQPNKIVYDIDIQRLVKAGQSGHIRCDLVNGIDTNGDGTIDLSSQAAVKRVASGQQVADCPRLISVLNVDDQTTGGPHWGAFDNHSLTADGFPTRMVFSDYFVARSGVDGNHTMYLANIDPKTGKLSYDNTWRDQVTGNRGVSFNRTNWPGNPGAGFYKPHSMVWVCPPGVCPADSPGVGLPAAGGKTGGP